MSEQLPGYARVVAGTMVHQQLNKPFSGRPYLKYGQCIGLWSYLSEIGGILGAKHAANFDVFVSAFLGMSGSDGAAKRFFVETANKVVGDHPLDSMQFFDYIQADFISRIGYTGDAYSFFAKHGTEKIPPETAAESAWGYASAAGALGALHPDLVHAMFERTYAARQGEEWERAHDAGLDIPAKQPLRSYKEAEETENKDFRRYCRECRPDLYSILSP